MSNEVSVRRSSSVKLPWKGNPTIQEMQKFCEAALAEGANPLDPIVPQLGTVPGVRPGLPEITIVALHVSVERVL